MKTINLNGTEYKLPVVTNTKLQTSFLGWARVKLHGSLSPLSLLRDKLDGLPPEVQIHLAEKALDAERQQLNYSSPEIQGLLATPEGSAEFVRLFWQYYQPDLTPDLTWELHEAAMKQYGEEYVK